MSQKHFILIAAEFKTGYEQLTEKQKPAYIEAVYSFMKAASQLNPRFNRYTFLKACGIVE